MLHKTSVSSYHQTDSLLFQFVLCEYLLTLEEAAVIQQFTSDEVEGENYVERMTDYLMKLAGSEKEYMRIFSWILDSGVLTKLKNYSDLLSERANKADPDFIKLHNAAHKAWIDCLHAVDFIREHEKGHLKGSQNLKGLKDSVEKTLGSIKKLTPVIKRILPKYAEDENVIYFILRHHKRFDQNLGKGWTQRLLKKLHPRNLLSLLKNAFLERGFDELMGPIERTIHELNQNEASFKISLEIKESVI